MFNFYRKNSPEHLVHDPVLLVLHAGLLPEQVPSPHLVLPLLPEDDDTFIVFTGEEACVGALSDYVDGPLVPGQVAQTVHGNLALGVHNRLPNLKFSF